LSRPFDATTKELLEAHPEPWLRLLLGTDVGRVSVLNADLSTITTEADKVLRVDVPEPWLVHVEFQSRHDLTLPLWLQRYNLLMQYRHDLPVQSLAVLLRPAADGPDLTGLLEHRLPNGELYHWFRYKVVRAWELPVEVVMTGGTGILPMAPLADVTPGALPEVFRRIGERLRHEPPNVAAKLWTATYLLMGLRYPEVLTETLFRGVRAMEDSVTYQAILRRGRVEGKVEEAKQLLLRMGRKRFGPPEPRTVAAIEAIAELERVEGLADRLLDVASWDELLATP
jgi:predicted transposase YdaD